MTTIIKKIPGLLPPPPKTEIDGKITDLSSKNIPELLELKHRQLKLINNKSFISKLPDRGEKIKFFYEKIVSTLKEKEEEIRTCHLFNKLNLGIDKQSVQDVEWKGKFETKKNEYLDSDDDSDPEDVLQILSQSTSLEKKVKELPPEKPLITAADIKSITEMPHIKYIVEKTESNPKSKLTGQFKPFKTTKSDVHNPEKEIHRKKHKNWEVTSATPPPIVHGPAKLLTLEESLKLQKDYNVHLKEIETQNAAEKLLARAGIKMSDLPADTSKFGGYREAEIDDPETIDEQEKGSGFTVWTSVSSDREDHEEELHEEELYLHR